MEVMMKRIVYVLVLLSLLLAGCGAADAPADTPTTAPTDTPVPPTSTPEPTATPTPEPTPTDTPEPTATSTPKPTPTPTEAPCSHVDLNGRYTDFREWRGAIYGWFMEAEQTGCDFVGMEVFYLRASGPGSESKPTEITGTIDGDRMRVCYTESGYCLNLAILEGGDVLANGVEGWYYERDK